MNREIKFRVWDKKEKKMSVTFNLIDYGEECVQGLENLFTLLELPSLNDESNIILMQFTGLKDKNDKEIYDGDILNTGYAKNHAIVSMKYGCWNATLIGDKESTGIAIGHPDTLNIVEIIGNIHDNPELLEKSK